VGGVDYAVALRGGYPLHQFDRLVRALEPLHALQHPIRLRVNLEGLAFISPGPLAFLVAAVRDLSERALISPGSDYVQPKSALVRRYLARMDVERLLLQSPPPEDFARRDGAFCPCQPFATGDEVTAVADSLKVAVTRACETDRGAEAAIAWALNEVIFNVLSHARSPSGGIGIAQGWPRRRIFEVAVADCGVGIRSSLCANPAYATIASDAEAIRLALEPGVTGVANRPRGGLGLYLTRFLLSDNGGLITVRSGSGEVVAGTRDAVRTDLAPLRGTLVVLRARSDRPIYLSALVRRALAGAA
jgi:hypothetical protein